MNMEKGDDFLKAQHRLFSVSQLHWSTREISFISIIVLFMSIP